MTLQRPFFLLIAFLLSQQLTRAQSYQMDDAFPHLAFEQPIGMAAIPGDTSRLCVIQRTGKVRLIADVTAAQPECSTLLDINSVLAARQPTETLMSVGEQGLLGLAFHPAFSRNGFIYVFYSVKRDGLDFERLARFTVKNPGEALLKADPASEYVLIEQLDDADNHNGGDLHFGPDGYLYVSVGDEGKQNDLFDNTQRITKDFFSGILRLDVDKRPGNLEPNPHPNPEIYPANSPKDAVKRDSGIARYSVPKDNPFVGAASFNGVPLGASAKHVRAEFWAVGLRNPWRFSFDSKTGELWCGDVGGGKLEEINIIQSGGNYGWAYREGSIAGPKPIPAEQTGFAPLEALHEYQHGFNSTQGVSISGGIVYHGSRFPTLAGQYIYADFASGNVWALQRSAGAPVVTRLATRGGLAAFHADPSNGDVLAADYAGSRIVRLMEAKPQELSPLWAAGNVFASDLVPFGKPLQNTQQRLDTLTELGIKRYVFSCREENLDVFDGEVREAKKRGIELFGVEVKATISVDARDRLFQVIEKHGIHPQIWVFAEGGSSKTSTEDQATINRVVDQLRPFVTAAQRLDCQVGLYNHGGWFGVPENQLAMIERFENDGFKNVGMICNFHHSHKFLIGFHGKWGKTQSHILAVNLNGTVAGANTDGTTSNNDGITILPLSAGDQELGMMRVIQESGWRGPVGIIGHRFDEEVKTTLGNNLRGLDWLAHELAMPGSSGERQPFARGHTPPPAFTLCAACHAADGKGLNAGTPTPMAPSLVGSKLATAADGQAFAAILLSGIEKQDAKYAGMMAPLGSTMNDEQMAELMTYVRRHFGNQASTVTPEQVKTWREQFTGKPMFKRSELESLTNKP
jgi:glucose/arabinose dehydrogenase/mono/diheme cytochrome c family protein